MRSALKLAARGLGKTRPNPAVGAVLVKDNKIIGRGYHKKCGSDHAEIQAIKNSKASPQGADIFVTLEPCGHYGRTPPCAQAIVEAKIKKVFYGCADPNPKTAGKGLSIMKQAGIKIVHGPMKEEVEHFNGPYLKWITKRIPLVTAKWAMTMDGKIATKTNDSKWITSKEARKVAHEIRNIVDAIVVGTTTALEDDPELTCRIPSGKTPLRVVLDRTMRLPLNRRLYSTLEAGPVLVYTAKPECSKARSLKKLGIYVTAIKEDKTGGLDLRAVLRDLGRRSIHHLLVEGGGTLLGKCFDLSLIDRTVVFVAPKISGGKDATTPVSGSGVTKMSNALPIVLRRTKQVGPDFVFWGDLGVR